MQEYIPPAFFPDSPPSLALTKASSIDSRFQQRTHGRLRILFSLAQDSLQPLLK